MNIVLYSEFARQAVVNIRNEIRHHYIGWSYFVKRSISDPILKSDKDHHKEVLNFPDFYSLSEVRDLLFHVKEHRFTIPQIKDYLDKLGLKFCGLEAKKIVSHFKQTNKNREDLYNLDKWQAYEQANPSAFIVMYQFWCQKVDWD